MIKYIVLIYLFLFSLASFANVSEIVRLEVDIENNVKRKLSRLLEEKDYIVTTKIIEKKQEETKKNKKTLNKNFEVTPLTKFDFNESLIVEENIEPAKPKLEIQKISVQVYLNSLLSADIQNDVKSLLSKTLKNIAGHKIEYNYESFTKTPKKVELPPKLAFHEKHPIVTIAAIFASIAIILLLFGFSRFQKIAISVVKALEGINIEGGDSVVSGANGVAPSNEEPAMSVGGNPSFAGESSGSEGNVNTSSSVTNNENHIGNESMEIILPTQDGLERFVNYIETEPASAANLIRKWNMMNTSLSNSSVAYIFKSLDFNLLKSFMLLFSEKEKKIIKQALNKPLLASETKQIENFIVSALIDIIIEPSIIEDEELNKSLFSTDITNLVQISEENPILGSELLSILPETVTTKVFEELNQQSFAQIMSESLNFSKEKLKDNFEQLRVALDSAPEEEIIEISPILQNTELMLPSAGEEKEKIIINVLVKTKTKEEFTKLMYDNFPTELFSEIPDRILAKTISSMNINLVAQLVSLFDEAEKNKIYDLVGPKDSKIRDIYELEFDKVQRSEVTRNKVKSQEHILKANYKKQIRKTIKSNQLMISPILNKWIESKYDSEGSLKIAS